MPADTFSSFIGMTLQATGNNNNAWGTILNGSSLQILERGLAGNITNTVTGGTLDLSGDAPPNGVSQVLDFFQAFNGALTSNQIVIVPNLSKFWLMDNQTTGAFQLLVQTPSGALVNVPQGTTKFLACDGHGNLIRLDRDTVGHFEYSAVVDPGFLQCSGQSLLKTDYPDLYAKIGSIFGSVDALHFTLPLLTDTGRFLRSVTSTLTVGTYQANQNLAHTHAGASFSGTTSSESAAHTHTFSGSSSVTVTSTVSDIVQQTVPFFGSVAAGAGGGVDFNGVPATSGITSTGTVSISGTTSGESANHTHTVSGTTGTIPSSGGTEARPEALAVIVSIRY